MGIEWNDNLMSGVPEIDRQHMQLFDRINDLFSACREGAGADEILKTMDFLGDYVVTHFGAEEKFMADYNYPKALSHHRQHEVFTRDFAEIRKTIADSGPGPLSITRLNRLLREWLIAHVRSVDREMGEYLKQKMPAT